MKLTHFEIDPSRHALVVDVEFYQMNLKNVVDGARKNDPELFSDEGIYLPAWSKFAKSPIKAKGFWTYMLQSVFDGKHGYDELNFDFQRNSVNDSGVYMMFMPGNMKIVCLREAALLAESALQNFSVVVLSSINGVTNASAQSDTKDAIELARRNGKKVLILSTCLAQRSFSVGEISGVFLAYDNGEAGATIQKISRGLTPSVVGKIGRIVSLSFDPHRDDKLDSLILQTAVNYQKSHDIASIKEALALVLKTVDIFSCQAGGAVKIDVSTYLEEIVNQARISRVVGRISYVDKLSESLRQALLNSNFSHYVPATDEVAQKGKAIAKKLKKGTPKQQKQRKTEDQELREKIVALCENLDVVVYGTNSNNMAEAIKVLKVSKELQVSFQDEAGMPYTALKELIDSGAINLSIIELVKY